MTASKKIEILVIEDDSLVIHRSVSTVEADANPFNVAIQAMVNSLTGNSFKPVVRVTEAAPLAVEQPKRVPMIKGTPLDKPLTDEQRTQAMADAQRIIARQREEEAESRKNIKNIERQAWENAGVIKMSDVVGGVNGASNASN